MYFLKRAETLPVPGFLNPISAKNKIIKIGAVNSEENKEKKPSAKVIVDTEEKKEKKE